MDMKINIFGTLIAVTGTPGACQAYYLGAEGKRRPADFIVPGDVAEHDLCEYLADLFHEDATPRNNTATEIRTEISHA